MNPFKRTISVLIVLACITSFVAAAGIEESGSTTVASDPGYPLTVVDDTGVELTFDAKPQRIVSVTIFTDDILLDLVDTSRLLAVTTFAEDSSISNVAAKVSEIPNKIALNVEVILSLAPDVVFVANWSEADKVTQLRDAGINVYLLESGLTVSRIQEQIAAIAQIVGQEAEGQAIIDDMDARLKAVQDKVSGLPEASRKSVLDYAIWGTAPGEGTSWAEILYYAGVTNSVKGLAVNEWGQVPVSREKLVEMDPDILILPGWVYGDPQGAKNNFSQMVEDPALKGMKAVQNGNVYMMPESIKTSTSQYIVDAVEWLAETAYPELFK